LGEGEGEGEGKDWHLQIDSRFRPQELEKRPQSMN
jgi:hypothetical protein